MAGNFCQIKFACSSWREAGTLFQPLSIISIHLIHPLATHHRPPLRRRPPTTTMAARISQHALLLPTRGDPLNEDQSGTISKAERSDDYLSRRHEFWTKDPPSRTAKILVEDVPSSIQGTVKDVMNPLRKVSSQIEIAMALCCERIPTQLAHVHNPPRSAPSKRIALPTPSTNTPDTVASAPSHDATNLGILREGKEGYFLKLLSMYCPKHAVGNRALAVAILQRTVQWERSSLLGNTPSEPVSSVSLPDTMGEQNSQETNSSLDIGRKVSSFMMTSTRTTSFLAAGMLVCAHTVRSMNFTFIV